MSIKLTWLPRPERFEERVAELEERPQSVEWATLVGLANQQLDHLQTNALDRLLRQRMRFRPPEEAAASVRLAVLGSSTSSHLLPAIRVAALRRSMSCEVFEGQPGRYVDELRNEPALLDEFRPNCVLLALDSHHLAGASVQDEAQSVSQRLDALTACWTAARRRYDCPIFQTTLLPVFEPLLGNQEWRLDWSPAACVAHLNAGLRERAAQAGVNIIAMDERAARDGLRAWYSPRLWRRTKQEIHPGAAPIFGDLVARAIGAEWGRSWKCLVFDLDNTLWGGAVGEIGVERLRLGPTTPSGEAYTSFQEYLLHLSRRGVILAACSKNDEKSALSPFEEQHPGMALSRSDIACFRANWRDKSENLVEIAETLNIGLDSMVFVDDSPHERDLIRRRLPMVAVPELPPSHYDYTECLASAGYFEASSLTKEDVLRTARYQIEGQRKLASEVSASVGSGDPPKESLFAGPFDETTIRRAVQLINRTSQFNFTTRRYSEPEVRRMMADPGTLTVQISFSDRFGDAGVICAVIGKRTQNDVLDLDTFVMSCRALGREIEYAALDIVAGEAIAKGVRRITGQYKPTERNGIVRDLYARLGFLQISGTSTGASTWELDLHDYRPRRRRHLTGRCNFREWLQKRSPQHEYA